MLAWTQAWARACSSLPGGPGALASPAVLALLGAGNGPESPTQGAALPILSTSAPARDWDQLPRCGDLSCRLCLFQRGRGFYFCIVSATGHCWAGGQTAGLASEKWAHLQESQFWANENFIF